MDDSPDDYKDMPAVEKLSHEELVTAFRECWVLLERAQRDTNGVKVALLDSLESFKETVDDLLSEKGVPYPVNRLAEEMAKRIDALVPDGAKNVTDLQDWAPHLESQTKKMLDAIEEFNTIIDEVSLSIEPLSKTLKICRELKGDVQWKIEQKKFKSATTQGHPVKQSMLRPSMPGASVQNPLTSPAGQPAQEDKVSSNLVGARYGHTLQQPPAFIMNVQEIRQRRKKEDQDKEKDRLRNMEEEEKKAARPTAQDGVRPYSPRHEELYEPGLPPRQPEAAK